MPVYFIRTEKTGPARETGPLVYVSSRTMTAPQRRIAATSTLTSTLTRRVSIGKLLRVAAPQTRKGCVVAQCIGDQPPLSTILRCSGNGSRNHAGDWPLARGLCGGRQGVPEATGVLTVRLPSLSGFAARVESHLQLVAKRERAA